MTPASLSTDSLSVRLALIIVRDDPSHWHGRRMIMMMTQVEARPPSPSQSDAAGLSPSPSLPCAAPKVRGTFTFEYTQRTTF